MTTPQTAAAAPLTGANVVNIYCKMPHGLKMEIGTYLEDGYETYSLKAPLSGRHLIDGTGATVTQVPREFWEKWLAYSPKDKNGKIIAKEPNKRLPCIVNGLVYAHESRDHVEAHAIERAGQKTGLEALNPDTELKAAGLEKFKED